jgi:GNAT superfamily N-acetyltransferase
MRRESAQTIPQAAEKLAAASSPSEQRRIGCCSCRRPGRCKSCRSRPPGASRLFKSSRLRHRERQNVGVRSVVTTRYAMLDDSDEFFRTVQAGFDSYVEFAPAGWQPPKVPADRARSAGLLGDPATWALIAVVRQRSVGHAAFFPDRAGPRGLHPLGEDSHAQVSDAAYFWQLFVAPAWWGRGVAPLLHDAAIDEMRGQGYRSARLFTPSLHLRARRFYERRGWSAAQEEWSKEHALTVTEYRLGID